VEGRADPVRLGMGRAKAEDGSEVMMAICLTEDEVIR
jgi:hypothetical protein